MSQQDRHDGGTPDGDQPGQVPPANPAQGPPPPQGPPMPEPPAAGERPSASPQPPPSSGPEAGQTPGQWRQDDQGNWSGDQAGSQPSPPAAPWAAQGSPQGPPGQGSYGRQQQSYGQQQAPYGEPAQHQPQGPYQGHGQGQGPYEGQGQYPGHGSYQGPGQYPGQGPYPGQGQQAPPPGQYPPGQWDHSGYGQSPATGAPGSYPDQQPQKKRRFGAGAIAGIVGGVVVVAAVAAGAVWWFSQPGPEDMKAAAPMTTPNPTALVEGYMTAIADGDAARALSYLPSSEQPGDTSFLSDDVLGAAQEQAPISELTVEDVGDASDTVDVPVTYRLGDQDVSTAFTVSDPHGNGKWLLENPLASLDFSQSLEQLGATVNGQEITAGSRPVFPGAYEISLPQERFELEGESTVVVDQAQSYDTSSLEPTLTDQAVEEFRNAVLESAQECVASSSLEAGCGLSLPGTLSDGTQLEDGSLERNLPQSARREINNLQPVLSDDEPTVARGILAGADVPVTADCRQGGRSGRCEISPDLSLGGILGVVSIDMAADELEVEWLVETSGDGGGGGGGDDNGGGGSSQVSTPADVSAPVHLNAPAEAGHALRVPAVA